MNSYVLSFLTKDHPGIIAGVSTAIGSLGGSILSCSQTVLHGFFTLISIVTFPKEYEPNDLVQQILRHDSIGDNYLISAAKMEEHATPGDQAKEIDEFVITAFGDDEKGMIERFSRYAADHDINIVDLFGDQTPSEFVVIGQLEVPRYYDTRVLQDDLEEIGRELGFTIKMQHRNIFVATNQIRFN